MTQTFELPASVDHPELFFALVGPLGTDMDSVADAREAELCAVGYQLERGRKLSELLHGLAPFETLSAFAGKEDERISEHMDAGHSRGTWNISTLAHGKTSWGMQKIGNRSGHGFARVGPVTLIFSWRKTCAII